MSPNDASARYRRVLLGVTPRLLGLLDREPRSPTRGSFDRVHWSWKFRDFPLNMWQASMMPLAALWRDDGKGNPYTASDRLLQWVGDAIEATLRRQHRNGAFDSFTPYSQDHGVTLAMVLTLATTVETLGDELPPSLGQRVRESIVRGCRFAARSEEDYAFISNHQAAFALAYARAGRLLGSDALLARADDAVARVLAHQSPDGWFEEYGGPDPGYETFALTYLALIQRERPSAALAAGLSRSVAFLAHCVHPDGSIGGNYGARHTAQFAPGGLELLSGELPMAASIADFVGNRLDEGSVVTPLTSDDDNLPLLTFSYAVAMAATRSLAPRTGAAPLPCETPGVSRRFDDSGIAVATTQRYFIVTNLSKGGVLRMYDLQSAALAYEDSGFLLRSSDGEWVSHHLGASKPGPASAGDRWETSATFSALKQEILTPAKFLVLRLLNLTVFRSVALGALVRRMIIARLITGRRTGPWALRRVVELGASEVVIRDEVVAKEAAAVTFASLERSLLPMHMGSAKYFHASELVAQTMPMLEGWCELLSAGRPARVAQVVRFGAGGATIERAADVADASVPLERHTA